MAQVHIEKVSKAYRGARGTPMPALAGIDLSVKEKEFLVLVGPSGCGKSTLLRLIAGLEEIDEGTISIGGIVVNQVEPKDRDIAMVFQNYALYPHMTVRENMAFGLKLRKFSKPEIDRRVTAAAETLGLTPLLDRLPAALSGGQRQRVAVGRAIVRQPKVFLFDEPLSNLDAQMRLQMRGEIARLHQQLNATMIYVTHDQVEAMTLGHRIVVMNQGRIQQVADPLTVYREPANRFVAGFIGSPPMNFFSGQLESHASQPRFVTRDVPALNLVLSPDQVARVSSATGREIILGLRPELVVPVSEFMGTPPNTVPAVLEMVEPLGAETYWWLRAGPVTFAARVSPERKARPGDAIEITFMPERAHFFSPESGARI